MADSRPKPLGAVLRGLAAGVAGTAVMTVHQELQARLKGSSGGGGGQDADPWESAPAPAKVAKRILEGVFKQDVSADRIPLLTNAMHWFHGITWGAVYGIAAGSTRTTPLAAGPLFGGAVWASSYAELVPMGIYDWPWKYPPTTLASDLGFHLTYGTGTALAYAALDRSSR